MFNRRKLFYAEKKVFDFNKGSYFYEKFKEIALSQLEKYYLIFDKNIILYRKVQLLITKIVENVIPLNRPYIDGLLSELVYYPISVDQVDLSVFHTDIRIKSESDLKGVFIFVDFHSCFSIFIISYHCLYMILLKTVRKLRGGIVFFKVY
jgi:hypothetical protein|tara:strand:- start:200 stop:649 length:450 start_codon:yes stop_codon:yes gene_type:complete